MCDRDRLCPSRDDLGESSSKEKGADDPEDYGYHTPKNIFNAEMSRLSQMQLSYVHHQTSPIPGSDTEVEEENPYSTIKKSPLRSSMMKNLESLIQKNASAQPKTRSVFFNDTSMDNMLQELQKKPLVKKLPLWEKLRDMDHVDLALFISFILLLIFGFFGFYILLSEF